MQSYKTFLEKRRSATSLNTGSNGAVILVTKTLFDWEGGALATTG
jgi:hypothetical protein